MKPKKQISYIIEYSVKGENRWFKLNPFANQAYYQTDVNLCEVELKTQKREDKLKRFQFRIVEETVTTEYKVI